MTFLGNALLKLGVDRKGLDEGLKGAEKRTDEFGKKAEKSTGKISKGFGKIKGSIVGSSAQIPVFGGLISKVLGAAATGPIGLATAGLVAMGAAVAASVTKIANLEKELRPMIARSGIAGESLQVLAESAKRAGSEDGLEGVTDGSQELQLRLAELVQDGTGPAGAAFDKLGLSSEDLIDKSPEEAFLATVEALQGVTSAADKKFLADELMGGSSEKLSGILNLTSEEFAALTENVRENADIVSNEGLESGRQFNGLMTEMKDVMGKAMTTIGEAFLPVILDLVDAFRDIYPEIKPLISLIGWNLRLTFEMAIGLLKIVAAVLRGDFAGAWREIKLLVLNVVDSIIANVENLIEFLPDKFVPDSWEQGVKDARAAINTEMDAMKDEAKAAADDTADAVEDAGGRIATSAGDTATAVGDATTSSIRSWTAEQDAAKDRRKNLAKEAEAITKKLKDEHEKRLEETRKFWEDMAKAQAKYRSEQHTADLDQYDATETEYKLALASLSTMSAEHLEALQAGNDDASDHELAMQIIANRRYADEQKAADDAAALIAETAADDALAADIAHRADLVTALDSHIDIVAAAMETADGDEKTALIKQLADLKKERDAAHVATKQDLLAAKQAEIDEVAAKVAEAQGAERRILELHHAALAAEYSTMSTEINAALNAIKTPKIINIVAKLSSAIARSTGDRSGGDPLSALGWLDHDMATGATAAGASMSVANQTAIKDAQAKVNAGEVGSLTEALGGGRPEDFNPEAAGGGIFPPRPGGQLVNVGEGGEPEAILNPGQLADVMGIGGGDGGSSQPMEFLIQLGDETLATVYVEGKRVAVREGRD